MHRIRLALALTLLALFAFGCARYAPPGPPVIPRAAEPPALDGFLGDNVWKHALVLDDFSRSGSLRLPSKQVTARLLFDDNAIYVAVECAECDPAKLNKRVLAENDDVWSDDSAQLWFRATDDWRDFTQFLANPIGTRGWNAERGLAGNVTQGWKPAFRVKCAISGGAWSAEFAIPFSDLGMKSPVPGRSIQVKIGRGDVASRPTETACWPPGARFGGPADYATVYFESAPPGASPLARPPEMQAVGPAIPVKPGEPVVVRKLLVTDCRSVRGFIGVPVDGTTDSWGVDSGYYEYNAATDEGAGTVYGYRHNDGLHIRLADARGFNAIQVRGGARAKVYRDVPSYTGPEGGTLIADLPGGTRGTSRLWFQRPVAADCVSFFNVTDGYLADVSFFRVSAPANLPTPVAVPFHDREMRLGPDKPVEFSYRAEKETPLAAVGMEMEFAGPDSTPLPMTVCIKDPVNPRSDLFAADFEIARPGRVRLILDFPDQILPANAKLLVTLKSPQPAKVRIPAVDLYVIAREQAAPEALAYRKLLLRGMYCSLSEGRPWNVWYPRDQAERWLESESSYAPRVRELLLELDHCRYIDAGRKDDEIRQYYEWIWRWVLRKEGKAAPFEATFDDVPGAPRWAVLAHQAWMQARAVPKWWLDHRIVPTGQFGGDVGDDADMYGNYADFPMFESDGVAGELKQAAEHMAEFMQAHTLVDGLNRTTTDPLHAYEEGLNHNALMAFWHYGDPVYLERCMESTRSVERLTVVTPKGHRHFRSQEVGAGRQFNPLTDIDGHAHPLLWHEAFEVVRYNNNPTALKWLKEWADGWLAHMQPGKYAGSVDVATERVTDADNNAMPGGYGGQGSAFESLYWVTGDEKYVAPFVETYARRLKDKAEPSRMIAELYQRGALDSLGDKLPAVLAEDPVAFAQATGDTSKLEEALKADITELQRFPMMFTSCECVPDRVFLYPLTLATKCYTGGFETRNKYCRTHAVSWEGLGTDYAALVLEAKPTRFKALVYNFADHPLEGRMRLWTLEHGTYRITPGDDSEQPVEIQRGAPVEIVLAPKNVTAVTLVQTEKLDDERERADLALSPVDTKLGAGFVESVAHNIGSKDAAEVVVALVDDKGVVREKKSLGPLAAPVDLIPKRIPFRFDNLPADTRGWAIVIDPYKTVKEIYEGNNRVELK